VAPVRRYLQVYRAFVATAFVRELEFRANFFAKLAQNLIWSAFFLFVLLVIYRNTDAVAGWTRGDAFILAGTVFTLNALMSAFFFSLTEIPQQVRLGTLDYVITKPIDSQFWISTRKFNFSQIGTLFAGLVLVVVGVREAGLTPTFTDALAYAWLVLISLTIFYSFQLMLMTTGIWLVRVDNLWVLGDSVMEVSRFPVDIFPSPVQRIFTFVVPIAFIATIPARQLVLGLDAGMLVLGSSWGLVFFVVSRSFWRFALRHYASASS
jgi:ABC-2 type transport system permease protein